MEYISSDTNVWIDFNKISRLDLPFRLKCQYIMFDEAIERELVYPAEMKEKLKEYGLLGVSITVEELFYADELASKYRKLSKYDRIALAIAKERNIILLTGDNPLRNAAKQEGVTVMGTLGLLDRLLAESRINDLEYIHCLKELKSMLGKGIRLPEDAIDERLGKESGVN